MDQDIDRLLSLFMQLKRAFIESHTPKKSFEKNVATFLQSHVLFFLEKHPKSTLNEIAKQACASPSSTTQLMERLYKSGLISREADKKDRRITRHSLTEKGVTKIAQVKKEKHEHAKQIFSKLEAKDIKTLIIILEKLLNNLE